MGWFINQTKGSLPSTVIGSECNVPISDVMAARGKALRLKVKKTLPPKDTSDKEYRSHLQYAAT